MSRRLLQLFFIVLAGSLTLHLLYGGALLNSVSDELKGIYKITMPINTDPIPTSKELDFVTPSEQPIGSEANSPNSMADVKHSEPTKGTGTTIMTQGGVAKVNVKINPQPADNELRKRDSREVNDTRTTVLSPMIIGDRRVYPLEDRRTVSGACPGRAGNQMFKHAALLGLALEFNRTLLHDTPLLSHGFANLTSLPDYLVNESDPSGAKTKRIGTAWWGVCNTDAIKYISTHASVTHIIITGFMQAWCYFDKHREQIRKEFTFHANLTTSRDKYLSGQARAIFGDGINTSAVTYIGVHIRRGDMMWSAHKGYSVADEPYLQHAVAYMENKLQSSKNKLYVIASDDKVWPKEHFKAPSPAVFVVDKVPDFHSSYYDMAILAGCNHSIITVGSYGWWSAYLAGGITVYYTRYPAEGSNLQKHYNRTEHYLPEWIGLE